MRGEMSCDSLLVVTEIRRALAEARTLEDVLAIREKAEAMRRLLKVKDESLAAQNEMAEITVLAEVLLGESIARMDKAKGGRGKKTGNSPLPVYSEIGIAKIDAHRWQTMAKAKRRISALLKQATESGKEFTRAMVYREGKKIREASEPKTIHAPKKSDPLDFVNDLREACDKIWDKCPEQWRGSLSSVLRSIADEFEERLQDGHGRRAGTEATSVA